MTSIFYDSNCLYTVGLIHPLILFLFSKNIDISKIICYTFEKT
ncbi:hypothetical protein bpmyx0001_28010 [Bacillus pseudomycoides DSM 12442]|nr:hypothetical protein bpmyx0001_28010 [Bacillus pseudomycoides DSM 12442]